VRTTTVRTGYESKLVRLLSVKVFGTRKTFYGFLLDARQRAFRPIRQLIGGGIRTNHGFTI